MDDHIIKLEEAAMLEVEQVKNRLNKYSLYIRSRFPEKLLVEDVAYPDQVTHLEIDLGFSNGHNPENVLWEKKYTNVLCKDIINFKNVETLILHGFKLSGDLWTQFAQNSTCLKEIQFFSDNMDIGYFDEFEFDDNLKGLEAVLKIPTLETVSFDHLYLPQFPNGPSNIKNLTLYSIEGNIHTAIDKCDYNNFYTHNNIIILDIATLNYKCPFRFSTLQLHKLENLEELDYCSWIPFDDNDYNNLILLLNHKKLKELYISCHYNVEAKLPPLQKREHKKAVNLTLTKLKSDPMVNFTIECSSGLQNLDELKIQINDQKDLIQQFSNLELESALFEKIPHSEILDLFKESPDLKIQIKLRKPI